MINITKPSTAPTVSVSSDVKEILSPTIVDTVKEQVQLPEIRSKYEMEIRESGIVDQLTSEININDANTILEFGKKPAEEMAQVADMVLQNYNATLTSKSSKLIDNLLAILDKIDCKELEHIDEMLEKRQKKSLFAKSKEWIEEQLNKAVNKYRGIGHELEAVVSELTMYETQIKQSNGDIERMYNQAIQTFKSLTAYTLAADDACKEIEQYRDSIDENGDQQSQFDRQNANNALVLMQQRATALQSAEALALQSIPAFKVQEMTNANLAAGINETFIITIPAFKSALVNSVIAKQQAVMAQGLSAVKEVNSRVIKQNADNVAKQLLVSQQLASTPAVKAEDIEYSMQTILNAAKTYKEREKQMLATAREEQTKIKSIETKYMQAARDNATVI